MVERRQRWAGAWPRGWPAALASLCLSALGCNALWAVDDLSFQAQAGGGQSTGGGASGGVGGHGATGGGGSGGNGGHGAGPTVDCSGSFGDPEPVLTTNDGTFGSPAIAVNRTELFYIYSSNVGALLEVRRSVRSNTGTFPSGNHHPELTGLCDAPTDLLGLDVSADGRRVYVGCGTATTDVVVKLAERPEGDDTPFAEVGSVATMGGSPAIALDELTLYTSGVGVPSTPLMATRDSLQQVFGIGMAVPGLDGVELYTPGPTPDHLTLFGFVRNPGWEVGYVTRTTVDGDYGAFTPVVTSLPVAGAPDVSADCRAVYFVGSEEGGDEPTIIYVMER